LGISVEELDRLSSYKTEDHKKALSKANSGKNWFSNDKLMISKQSKTDLGTDWYKGRKYGNKN
jgi:hypothetical protein